MDERMLQAAAAALEQDWLNLATLTELENLEAELTEPVADLIFSRIRLRAQLGLPANDCAARRPNPDCTCLTEALNELATGEPPTGDGVRKLAKKRHKRRQPLRVQRLSPAKPEPPSIAQIEPAPAPLPPLTETPTRRDVKPRFRHRESPHPLSIEAFRRSEQGPSSRDLLVPAGRPNA
jgi:hypothetical protein